MLEGLLPLFPLRTVLFPRVALPLHIFEERYRRMVKHCLERRSEFGVVLATDEHSVAQVGCTASIEEVSRRCPDGRMDIQTRGQRRFELLELDEEGDYLRGEARILEDEGFVPLEDARRAKALRWYSQLADLLEQHGQRASDERPAQDDPQLSYQIISRLPAELEFKQTLLQMREEGERLSEVIRYLERMRMRLEPAQTVEVRARSNGHRR